jgi:hypothetical protein
VRLLILVVLHWGREILSHRKVTDSSTIRNVYVIETDPIFPVEYELKNDAREIRNDACRDDG